MSITINGSTGISGVDGSASTPSYRGADSNTGISFGTDTLSLVTGGSERLYIDSSGKVGVGNNSPGNFLHIESTFSGTLVKIKNNAGSTSADTALEVESSTTAAKTLRVKNSGTDRFWVQGDGTVYLNGSVLVGTETAQSRFTIENTSATAYTTSSVGNNLSLINSNTSANVYTGIRFLAVGTGNTGTASINCTVTGSGNGVLTFSTRNASTEAEKMRLTNTGSLYVNSTSAPVVGTELFGVNGGSAGNAVGMAATCSTRTGVPLFLSNSDNTTNTYLARFATGSGGDTRGEIYFNGSQLVYATSSDYRLKENVKPLANGIDFIKQLRPVSYRWIQSQCEDIGFIAHEVQEVFPNAVGGDKDAVDKNGKILPQTYDPSKLVPLLTAALKEALVQIEDLKERVIALEG